MPQLTEEQISDIKYFWEYKGDLERYSSFEELKPLIWEQKPQIMKAWNDYKASIEILNAVIESL
jgi:hypothetical protein